MSDPRLRPENTVVSVVLPRVMREQVRAHSKVTGATLNAVVRIAVSKYLAEHKIQQTEQSETI